MTGPVRWVYHALDNSIIGWGVAPFAVVVGLAVARIRSRPKSPSVRAMLRRPFTVMLRQPLEDLAIGLDVVFAAIALQMGFMAEMASDGEALKEDNVFFEHELNHHLTNASPDSLTVSLMTWTSS